ncbi:thioredoxin family protein [Rathayibacter rathayi]|uniref:glutaredoxin family protein n=1 Tax=Rathayibacter rathayi TaxID=33887 RepID=UPI000CE74A1C|nr:glutaredoxin family protein [Rathayibacter rathayi]PPG66719.1 thioredoxin family protein [Rathayibacter rathayi]PPG76523.1 thioredoxin family protein [Rathayibacter rathayi]PPH22211.1 thioredoxin family protein [Rathayibacter rathayi]PPI76267.1 thioredoxin family protein [Rathayibacter rathayi]
MVDVELTLVGKPGCHLCDDARTVIEQVVADLDDEDVVAVSEVSILDDPVLYERYVEEIPVVLINGRMHTFWRVDPERLRRALLEGG